MDYNERERYKRGNPTMEWGERDKLKSEGWRLYSSGSSASERARGLFMVIEAHWYRQPRAPDLDTYASHWLWAQQQDRDGSRWRLGLGYWDQEVKDLLTARYPLPSHPRIAPGCGDWDSYGKPGYEEDQSGKRNRWRSGAASRTREPSSETQKKARPQATSRARPPDQSSAITEKIHEANLEALIADNLSCIEPGLTLVGRQHSAPPVGRIDLLCKDPKGNLVVIEIKSFGASTDSVIDQVTRYIGWVQQHIATPEHLVRGVVVVGSPDQKLAYSVRAIPNLSIKSFSVAIQSHSAEDVDLRT